MALCSDCPGLHTEHGIALALGSVRSLCSYAHGSVHSGDTAGNVGFSLQGRRMLLPHLGCLRSPAKKLGFLYIRWEAVSLAGIRTLMGPLTLRSYSPPGMPFCVCHRST